MDLDKLDYKDMPDLIIDNQLSTNAKGLSQFVIDLKHSDLTKEEVAMMCVDLAEKMGYKPHCDMDISEWRNCKRWARYFMTHTNGEYQYARYYDKDEQKLITLEEFYNK